MRNKKVRELECKIVQLEDENMRLKEIIKGMELELPIGDKSPRALYVRWLCRRFNYVNGMGLLSGELFDIFLRLLDRAEDLPDGGGDPTEDAEH